METYSKHAWPTFDMPLCQKKPWSAQCAGYLVRLPERLLRGPQMGFGMLLFAGDRSGRTRTRIMEAS